MEEEDLKRKIADSGWGDCVLDPDYWNESNGRVVNIINFESNDEEKNGILSDRLIGAHLSYLAKCPENGSYVLIKCNLSNMNLEDITALEAYKHIQYLDLSYNKLINLLPLGNLKYLTYLDVSHNELMSTLSFEPVFYLTSVNLSYNSIRIISDLSAFWSIVYLNLSHNSIETISGLKNLKHLKHLNLSYNQIECVENVENFTLEHLNLNFNCIKNFRSRLGKRLENLPNLRTLLLANNKISSLFFLHNAFCSLKKVDLSHNKIGDLLEASELSAFLNEIYLKGNPCTNWPYYREVLLHAMPTLTSIDDCEVEVSERVSSRTKFNPPVELLASRTISRLILLEQLNPPRIDDSIVPYDEPDPILIVLSGPSAVNKISLGLRIVEKMSRKVKYCRSYTTRKFSAHHDEVKAYEFVTREVFNEMTKNGEFLTVEELLGDSYGFHINEIAALRREKKIGITQMDLAATIQLRHRYGNVKSILVITKDEEIHRQWIRQKFKIFTWIKDSVENLMALTIGKTSTESQVETIISRANFISNIVDEIVEELDLPTYCNYIRPQGTGATATDIIVQSRMMLPRVTKTRKEITEERRIKFADDDETLKPISSKQETSDLKVILDESKNIIIDDQEAKKRIRLKRFLSRRKNLEENEETPSEFGSESSEESQTAFIGSLKNIADPKELMDFYVEVVMNSREIYIKKHVGSPGFYSFIIFSDDYDKALDSLQQFINTCWNQIAKKKRNDEIDYRNQVVIPKIIDRLISGFNTNGHQ